MEILQIALLLTIVLLILKKSGQSKIKYKKSRSVIIDSCGLIDGRIVALAKSGFINENLIIPEIVLKELQLLADGRDSHKRERARYGLDVVKELQANKFSNVSIDRTTFESGKKTDDALLDLAKSSGSDLYTIDYNLTKLAEIDGIRVLNVNELSQQIRTIALPGEQVEVKIMQRGSNPRQGVGYLEDGTMVVIDDAAKLKGRVVKAEVTKVHQTVAGKMIFATKIN
jgi:uncharacterized protein YacL